MNKKYIVIAIVIIVIIAICFGIYKIASSYMFDETGITNEKTELIDHLRNIENDGERKNQIDFSVEQNLITQQEANELY